MKDEKHKVPKLRFPEFTDDWEQRKLSDVTEEFQSGRFIAAKDIGETGEYPVYGGNGLRGYCNTYNHDGDYALIGRQGALCGNMSYSYGKAYFTEHAVAVKANDYSNTKFLYYLLDKMNLGQYSDQSAQPGLAVGKLVKLQNMFPSKLEQYKIGDFFTKIDDTVTLHQRKCDAIKEYKKGMLQKMFPKKGQTTPEIRFPGFTDDWEQRKFVDITYAAGKRNKKNLPLEPFAITNDRGFVPQNEAHDEFGYMKEVDRSMYMIVEPNSFAYNPARINVGSLGYYDGQENVVVSSLYEVFQTTEDIDDTFLSHWFKTKIFHNWIERLQEGSVRLYFYYDKLCECKIMIPSIQEQKKIGAALEQLDQSITLHQRKIEDMKELKRGLLQQMFV